ncbi:hypothetical protein ANN_05298 [Periplaneta americana]|uniref:Uncharacterized protein n=1 Tax=Periplaneta americana TaxID=6978 RepID=A0ABQ8TAS1_PERAM|nr:hypothetical protein ANN_05298 [Periplaneta americana]
MLYRLSYPGTTPVLNETLARAQLLINSNFLATYCEKGELLRKNRHHRARKAIVNLLRNRGWEVHEEIHCV